MPRIENEDFFEEPVWVRENMFKHRFVRTVMNDDSWELVRTSGAIGKILRAVNYPGPCSDYQCLYIKETPEGQLTDVLAGAFFTPWSYLPLDVLLEDGKFV